MLIDRLRTFLARLQLGYRLRSFRWARLVDTVPPSITGKPRFDRIAQWLDFLYLFDVYEGLTNFFSPGTRKLTLGELHLLKTVFGESLPYDHIRIDERAHLGPRQLRFLYVSFHTINSWGPIAPPTLVHEAVHVWQYTHLGAQYIPRALAAQRTEMGYNYGGLSGLQTGKTLEDFNYEQMADLIEDAFRLANGYHPQWVLGNSVQLLQWYFPFLRELRNRPLSRAYGVRDNLE